MKRSGFTLIEMAVVLFIISLLILIIIPNLGAQKKHAHSVHGAAMTTVVQTQIDAYYDEFDDPQISFDKLVSHDYLTDKQVKQAREEQIVIKNNHASQE
ncbi:Late competence protein ComGC, access of DNA to ComEA [Fructilactobacillus florum 8D]|uniref:Late competence protein ComGC, access of DNA to ComEA n=1 Tax=Fructilactobacillus florum 8D TaxID=1221538 RepID=W9EFA2_9LACO|nr:competence type IV pilus major pilin ComGC [Fructilactobacillus florum]ETO39916.1 Late competence protein ComGC, access of DNA to ComEA [Fructilactobacillus florum 8D]